MPKIKLALVGASGRMGKKVLEALSASDDKLAQSFSLVWSGSVREKKDLKSLIASQPELVIDFSKPAGTLAWTEAYAGSKKLPAALICSTGFSARESSSLKKNLMGAAWARVPNTSLGIFAMAETLKKLAEILPADYTFTLHESHHAKKIDSPSGTGLFLKSVIESVRKEKVQITSVRGGTDPGTHTVTIFGPHEKITLSHSAEDRALFARGSLVLGLALKKQKKTGPFTLADLMKA